MQAGCSAGCGFAFVNGQSAIRVTQTGSSAPINSVQMYPTGATCDASGKITNSSDTNVPTTPDIYPPSPDPVPRICGGGSCYDSASDQYCATSGGQQFCVSGSAGPSGGCASSGGSTICVGNPAPLPSSSAVPNPTTAIKSSDTYTTTSSSSASPDASSSVTANVYSNPGSSSTSGATSSDASPSSSSSPASSSSSPAKASSSDGSASGGGDCGTPTVCSGDAVACAVLRQTWMERCSQRWDQDSNGQPNWTKVTAADSAQYAVTNSPVSSVSSTVTVDGSEIAGTSWAGNTCPGIPSFTVFDHTVTLDPTVLCNWLASIRSIFLLICAFISMRILTGKSN